MVVSLAVLGGVVVLIAAALLWMLLPRSLAGAWRRVETLGVLVRAWTDEKQRPTGRLRRGSPGLDPGPQSALTEIAAVTARSEFSAAGASVPERAQALRTWRRALLAATLRPRRSPG